MKIAVCQINPRAGDLENNFSIIKKHYDKALNDNAQICIFPELSTSGYFAEDLFLKQSFIDEIFKRNLELVKSTGKTCLLLPTIIPVKGMLYNGVVAAMGGKVIGQTYKYELANYGIFDEKRYFVRGHPTIINVNGVKIGVPICADLWSPIVCKKLKQDGATLFLSPNGSPYDKTKMNVRTMHIKERFKETDVPIIYCNQALGHDGIIFDGRSFCFDGNLSIIGKSFATDYQIVALQKNKFHPAKSYALAKTEEEDIFKAMILGVRDYVKYNGFNKVVLGLSGGVDSALVALIAAFALGPENVFSYMLPSKFTKEESEIDATRLSKHLQIKLKTISIKEIVQSFCENLNINPSNKGQSITYQNLQSRIRGAILMAKANELGALLLTTGNKSEYATGYATIYGDMNGAFNPIKDIYKTDLYKVIEYINTTYNHVIPQSIIDKEPSAELAPDQKDSDSLPPYPILDSILLDYIEGNASHEDLVKKFDPALVKKIVDMVKNSEFKRKQSAPGVKISTKNFEKDRRYPITQNYD